MSLFWRSGRGFNSWPFDMWVFPSQLSWEQGWATVQWGMLLWKRVQQQLSLLWSRRTSTAENLDLCNMHGECFRGQFCWLLRSSMAWKLIAVTLQTHRTILTRTEAIMPVMGPFTWLALGGSTAFVGQVWRRGPWDRREIIFTHGQDFSVSCLQLCKQPSP